MSMCGAVVQRRFWSFLVLCSVVTFAQLPPRCRRGDPCWPTEAEIAALRASLDPAAPRNLVWPGGSSPRVCAVPYNSSGDQPLYGAGKGLQPMYVESNSDRASTCFLDSFYPEYCLISTRNNPLEGWTPAFVVWPLSAEHVQVAVKFAADHNLGVCVAGTGHDFLNRHSCDQGLMIRTALMKGAKWSPDESALQLGAGLTFSEAQSISSTRARFVASGWSITVGVVGWSLGGGHGPFGPSVGLGVDNLVAAELVTADGSLVTVNDGGTTVRPLGSSQVKTSNDTSLLWALRGGGGSTWGVITSLTVAAHPNPADGFTLGALYWNGTMCGSDAERGSAFIDHYLDWSCTLDRRWAQLAYLTPTRAQPATGCPSVWSVFLYFVFQGTAADAAPTLAALTSKVPGSYVALPPTSVASWWDVESHQAAEYISPVADLPRGVPSVVISRDQVAGPDFRSILKSYLVQCNVSDADCHQFQLFQAVPGNTDSPHFDPAATSISPGFRNAMMHVVTGVTDMAPLYKLAPNSYFSESLYNTSDWKQRFWGDNYDRLLDIKKQWDPEGRFWCNRCVGSD
mmetsp:Transcript_7446/g.23469  ORF Transcript_7446/g.23469 Transcript_7446/m.23469 type:complete len:569 (+) Transcript_7446:782-2488(+)